jgi:hypothetical protein
MKAGAQTSTDPALARALETLAEVAGRLGAAEVAEQVAEAPAGWRRWCLRSRSSASSSAASPA